MEYSKSILGAGLAAALGWGQVNLGTHNGCAATDADFTYSPLVNGAVQPLKVAFDPQGDSAVDVYFIERYGAMKKWSSGAVTKLGGIPVATDNEDGLVGLALDPKFKSNRNLFVMYSYQGGDESTFRISRFTLNAAGTLDLASEKILIRINSMRGRWHTGGAMKFDAYGDLWVAVGDNEEQENGPANTADMRGGILRIHPDNSALGYSIPEGNFGAVMAGRFTAAGNAALAAQYADPAKVRPEIYVKGTRNAYTLTLDPVRRWVTWGDVGPDQGKVSEEYNLVKAPDFMGWPYFAGDESMALVKPYGNVGQPAIPAGVAKTAPVNNFADLTGVRQLPGVRDPVFKKNQSCAMTGPIFRYNGDNPSPVQFPPQMNRKWIVSDCNGGYGFHLLTLNAAGDAVTEDIKIFAAFATQTLTDLQQGPDGALYVVNQGGGTIYVARYKGTCRDPGIKLENPVSARKYADFQPAWLQVKGRSVSVLAAGPHDLRVVDIRGRTVFAAWSDAAETHALPALPGNGVYRVIVRTRAGAASSALPMLSPHRQKGD